MYVRIILIAGLGCAALASGCAGFSGASQRATLVASDARKLPAGVQPAVVWTINGKRVRHGLTAHRLEPGRHKVSVLPRQSGPMSVTLAYAASARALGIEIAEVDVDLAPGQVLEIAAAVRHHRVFSTTGDVTVALGPWQTTVLPYEVAGD